MTARRLSSGDTGTYYRREARRKRRKGLPLAPVIAILAGIAVAIGAVWVVLGQQDKAREALSQNLHDNMMTRLTGGIDQLTITQNNTLRNALAKVHDQGVAVVLREHGYNADAGWDIYETTIALLLDADADVDRVYTELGIIRPVAGIHLGTAPVTQVRNDGDPNTPLDQPAPTGPRAPTPLTEDGPGAVHSDGSKGATAPPAQSPGKQSTHELPEREFGGAL